MFKKLLLILTATVLASVSAFSVEAKEVDWKLLQGLTVEEKKGKPAPKLTKELKDAMEAKAAKTLICPTLVTSFGITLAPTKKPIK